jgi:hypothetical protein
MMPGIDLIIIRTNNYFYVAISIYVAAFGQPGWRAVLAILTPLLKAPTVIPSSAITGLIDCPELVDDLFSMPSVSIALIIPLNIANKTTEIINATVCFCHFIFYITSYCNFICAEELNTQVSKKVAKGSF